MSTIEQVSRCLPDIRTVFASREPVDQDDERLPVDRLLGTIQHAEQDIAGTICHRKADALAGVRRQTGDLCVEKDRDGLQVRSPPGKTGTERRQFEGIDRRRHG